MIVQNEKPQRAPPELQTGHPLAPETTGTTRRTTRTVRWMNIRTSDGRHGSVARGTSEEHGMAPSSVPLESAAGPLVAQRNNLKHRQNLIINN